jgi:hypothetical protein
MDNQNLKKPIIILNSKNVKSIDNFKFYFYPVFYPYSMINEKYYDHKNVKCEKSSDID